MESLTLTDLPEHDRPRERLLRQGAGALSDVELVAIQLGSGASGRNAIAVAQGLLAQWGGLAGLARAEPAELARTVGIGPAKACRLISAFALAGRLGGVDERQLLATSADLAAVARPLIGRARVEQVLVLVADSGSRLQRVEVVAGGQAGRCPVPVRETLAAVLRWDGVAFGLAHNHPGGDPTPTPADVATTREIVDAAAHVGLRFLDHVVVTADDWRSVTAAR